MTPDQNVKSVASVVAGESFLCPACGKGMHPDMNDRMGSFTQAVNHCLAQHGWRLLHIGQQTLGQLGASYETTVAVLGP
jgi:hypothetical protein